MSGLKQKYKKLLNSAKNRGIPVRLNLKHYEELLKLGCMYCGDDLKKQNGYCLDRIDNNLGYIDNNVTPCCKDCNLAKGTKTVSEFVEWIKRCYIFQSEILNSLNPISKKEMIKMENVFMNKSEIKNSEIIKYLT